MSLALARYDNILNEQIEEHGGLITKSTGDGKYHFECRIKERNFPKFGWSDDYFERGYDFHFWWIIVKLRERGWEPFQLCGGYFIKRTS
jgi:hypothetical protein